MLDEMIQGRVWKFGKNISTDNIAPSRLFAERANMDEFKKYCLIDAREDFVKGVQPGDVIVADTNFGCGSSREIAPRIIKMNGTGAVLAKSFGRIFYRNAVNIGLLLIQCDTDCFAEGERLVIDVKNRQIKKADDASFSMPFSLSDKEIALISEGGLLNYIEKHNGLDFVND